MLCLGMVCYGMAWYMVWYGMVCYDMEWYGMVYVMVWSGTVRHGICNGCVERYGMI